MSDIANMNFEDAMKELETLVRDLDSGNVPLEKSVELYERGEKLKAHLQSKLDSASLKIQEITANGETKASDDLAQ